MNATLSIVPSETSDSAGSEKLDMNITPMS